MLSSLIYNVDVEITIFMFRGECHILSTICAGMPLIINLCITAVCADMNDNQQQVIHKGVFQH